MKEKKKQSLKDVFLPTTPVGWLLMGVGAMVFYAIPFDRIFDLMDKGVGYRVAITIAAFLISLPFYLRLRKKLQNIRKINGALEFTCRQGYRKKRQPKTEPC